MRAALIVHRVVESATLNLDSVIRGARAAADAGAELALFSEAALTGLENRDEPDHDLALGRPIPGPEVDALGSLARERGIWIALGLLERAEDALYDSAILIDPAGEIALHYRRNHPGWHWPDSDPSVYRDGDEIPSAETPWGRLAFLICGDLYDDGIVARVRAIRPRYLLVPFARTFDDGSSDSARWEREEVPVYAERVAMAGTTTLLVNHVGGDGYFGGALAVDGEGHVLRSLPVGREGLLLVDL